jgi:hypothetical protein
METKSSLCLNPDDFDMDPLTIHVLPCKINFPIAPNESSRVPVDSYFVVETLHDRDISETKDILVSNLRGRNLLGKREFLPSGSVGFLVTESDHADIDQGRMLQVEASFDSITYWKQDSVPKKDESIPLWFDQIAQSRALHGL